MTHTIIDHALDAIAAMVEPRVPAAAAAIRAVRAAVDALADGHPIDAAGIAQAVSDLRSAIAANDRAADDALRARFGE